MPENWKPSPEPAGYDEARVALIQPVEAAIQQLGLPLLRFRKLNGILGALTVQIEDGGDSPEVNRLLLNALRAGIRHQVDERQARVAWRAIDAFERAEARRWEQVRAGTLPPIRQTPEDRLDELMEQGYELKEARQTAAACDRWLEAWEIVKQLTRPGIRTTAAFDDAYPNLGQLVFNWCQDLEMELGNAGYDNSVYHEHRLRYAREFLARFPDESANFHVNFIRAQGEALWHLGRVAESEATFEALVQRLPDEAWGYIGWADQYWLFDNSPKDYARGEAILNGALARTSLDDRRDVFERLIDLYGEWGKPAQQAAAEAALKRLEEQPTVLPLPPPTRAAAERAEKREQTMEQGGRRLPTPVTPPAPSTRPSSPIGKPGGVDPVGAPVVGRPSPPARKPGRNDPCWCGTGKKYKRCHGQG